MIRGRARSHAFPRVTRLRLLFGATALLLAQGALAELSGDSLVGAGMRSQPAYDGANAQRGQLVPVLRYFSDPWFLRSTQDVLETGLRARLATNLHAGVQLAYEPGRITGESAFLQAHGLPDVDPGVSLGAHVEWDPRIGSCPLTLLLRGRKFTDARRGTQVDMRLSAGVTRRGPLALGTFVELTWANARSIQSFYGVSASQAALSNLPAFSGGGGLLTANAGFGARLDLSRHWLLVGAVETHRLRGNAARSPLAERSSNEYETLGLAYVF